MSSKELSKISELEMAVETTTSPPTRDLPHVSVEGCSSGDNHSIVDYFIDDTRCRTVTSLPCCQLTMTVEDEFFRRRTLSIGDFDGTRDIGMYPAHMILLILTVLQLRLQEVLKNKWKILLVMVTRHF